MIKHGKVFPISGSAGGSHLDPIRDFVKKGIADAREKIVLHPQACDVKGAKRFNGQQCVIAKCLTRTMKPQAVAVGRSLAYVVFGGLAIRFRLPPSAQKLVQEFDQRGRARNAPIELSTVHRTWRLGTPARGYNDGSHKTGAKRKRTKKYGVRAVGGGIVA